MDGRKWFLLLLFMSGVAEVRGCGSHHTKIVTVYRYPPSFSSCPSDISVTAPSGKASVTVAWKEPSAKSQKNNPVKVKRVNGPSSGTLFDEGPPVRISYQAYEQSTGLRSYCTFFVTVRVLYCQPLPYLQHGTRSCTGVRWNMHGSECTHTCDDGYRLKGAQTLTCGSNERWDRTLPTCEPVSCGPPGAISSGQVVCYRGYVYPEMCIITCDKGYRLSGTPFLTCQAGGTWSTGPTCDDAQGPTFPSGCPANRELYSGALETPVEVSWIDPVTNDNSGHAVTLTSDPARGSLLGPGFYLIEIKARDASGNTASCYFVVKVQARKCSSLSAPANGRVTCTRGYVEGSECNVTCNNGYEIQGQTILTCLQTEQWNSSPPSCVSATCPTLPLVQYGSFRCANGQTYLAICNLVCGEGFRVQGTPYIQCGTGGNWTQPGSCVDKQSPEFPDGCADNVEIFASRLGQPTLVKWPAPRVTDNSNADVQLVSDVQPGSNFSIGVTRVTYTATDVSGNTATCSFTVTVNTAVCSLPDLEPTNRTNSFMVYSCPQGYVFGASCTLNCTHGYPLVGSDTITCERDDSTYPPTMSWDWKGPSAVKPECRETQCPDLAPPENGALACLQGNFGVDCLMSCQEPYDVPGVVGRGGHFYCVSDAWIPSTVPGCVAFVRPGQARYHSDLFYYAGNCNTSSDVIKENFITRMNNDTILQNACLNVPTCVVGNVKVTCAVVPGRRKRSMPVCKAFTLLGLCSQDRVKRDTSKSHYVLVDFEIVIELQQNSSQTSQDIKQQYEALKDKIHSSIVTHTANGTFDMDGLSLDDNSVGAPTLSADCPVGTKSSPTNTFSCVGCSKGHFMQPNLTCEACPVGSYAELDNATSCTSCPPGWSTLSTASHNRSQCKELCRAGSVSPDGFVPCQPCPRGQYQLRSASRTCDPCPTNTWTEDTGARSLQQCVPADVMLTNSSLTGQIHGQWSVLTVSLWVSMPANSSMDMVLSASGNGSLLATYSLLTTDVDESVQPQNSNGSPSNTERIPPGTWSRVVFIAAVTELNGTQLPQNVTVLTVDQPVSDLTSFTVHTDNKRVFVSGLAAAAQTPTQEEINASPTSCMGNNSTNLLRWSPSPSTVSTPSVCDAVNECIPNPCGSHGVCENRLADFLCQCQDGWSGATCKVPPDSCYQHQCQNGATCVSGTGTYSCTCPQGFTGDTCADEIVDGGWNEWSAWSDCSATCTGQQQRQRQCNNPAPQHGGHSCLGNDTQTHHCGPAVCIVNGTWSDWTTWSPCSATCDGGETTRQRTCNNPIGSNENEKVVCEGDSSETEACNTSAVPCPVHGGWSDWTGWSSCSVTCGDGMQSRDRLCDNPVAADGGDECIGSSSQNRSCNIAKCPECSPLDRPRGGYWACTVTEASSLRNCTFFCLRGFVVAVQPPPFTCGPDTSYLWNHQRDHELKSAAPLPECIAPFSMTAASYTIRTTMNTGCDVSTGTAVADGIQQNLESSVPCLRQGVCTQQISTSCRSSSRKRSTPALQISAVFSLNLEASQTLHENTSRWSSYQQLIDVANQSLLLENQTGALFTVNLGGRTITPDVTSVVSSLDIVCPNGTIPVDRYCVPCPAGSMAESGQCVLCPLGQYQDQSASTSCKPCPDDLAWDIVGAYDVTLCRFPLNGDTSPAPPSGAENDGNDTANITAIVVVICFVILVFIVAIVVGCYLWNRGKKAESKRSPAWGSWVSLSRVAPYTPRAPSAQSNGEVLTDTSLENFDYGLTGKILSAKAPFDHRKL